MSPALATSATSVSATQNAGLTEQQKIARDMQALTDALKTNDLKAAQAAMVQLQIDTAAAAKAGAAAPAVNPLGKVADALQTGDVATARVEFSRFESAAAAAAAAYASASVTA